MIRIRFFGPGELNQRFSGCTVHFFFLPQVPATDGKIPRAPVPGKERLSGAEVLKKMKMPSAFSLIASRRVNHAMPLCRCPLDPLLGLLSAQDACPEQWSSLVLCDRPLRRLARVGVGHDLEDNAGKCQIRRLVGRSQRRFRRRCGNIDRSGAPVAFTVEQSTCPECSKLFKRGPKAEMHGHRKPVSCTLRMTVLCAQGATNTFRAGQSYLTMHSTVAKAAATRTYRHSQLKHDLLLFRVGSKRTTQGCFWKQCRHELASLPCWVQVHPGMVLEQRR